MPTKKQILRVREWLSEPPFEDARRLHEPREFSYEDWFERGRALPAVTESLIEILSGEPLDRPTRFNYGAAYALGWVGDRRALPTLLQTMNAPHPLVRMESVAALGRLGDVSVVDSILAKLNDPKEQADVRANACVALGTLKAPGAKQALERARRDGDDFIVRSAEAALRLLNE